MAENENGQEKTEEASQKRITESREKGQVPRSRELNTFLIMIVASLAFMFIGNVIIADILKILKKGWSLSRDQIYDTAYMPRLFMEYIFDGIILLTPFALILVCIAVIASIMLGGWNFSIKALAPKFSKMNPITGMKKVFGTQGLVELLKAVGKFFIIGSVGVCLLYWQGAEFLALGVKSLDVALANLGSQITLFFFLLCCSLILIAIADVPYQLWQNKKQLKMTIQEVKDEHKQADGNPEQKAHIRVVQREMAQRRMMEKVPTADVIITNPTHYAVALKYNIDSMAAPILVAKGGDELAMKIRSIATENHIPLLSSPMLARAVYYHTEVDKEIPMGLYTAVAKVLAYVFQLKKQPYSRRSRSPINFTDVEIPDSFQS